MQPPLTAWAATRAYWRLLDFYVRGGELHRGRARFLPPTSAALDGDSAALHVYALARTIATWDAPHYRAPTFGADVRANLRNVALPGTGVALSLFAAHRLTAWLFAAWLLPLCAMAAALFESGRAARTRLAGGGEASAVTLRERYARHLLDPPHWFALWRVNCALVAEHARVSGLVGQYALEEKGAFLLQGQRLGLPVTPFMDVRSLVIKHRAVEGGMGISFFDNFSHGGDYIIQERLQNSAFLAELLPSTAPLSTLRVITASRQWPRAQRRQRQAAAAAPAADAEPAFEVLTVVLRAGLAGASTDHASIAYTVDIATGELGLGRSNQHWYGLGLRRHALRVGASYGRLYTCHPDSGVRVTGRSIPDWAAIAQLLLRSHEALCPDVPLLGWDVALTPQGPMLLEVNMS